MQMVVSRRNKTIWLFLGRPAYWRIFFSVEKALKTAWHHDLQADCILTAICGDPTSIWVQVSRSRKVQHSTLGSTVLTQRIAMRKYSVRRRAHLQISSSLASIKIRNSSIRNGTRSTAYLKKRGYDSLRVLSMPPFQRMAKWRLRKTSFEDCTTSRQNCNFKKNCTFNDYERNMAMFSVIHSFLNNCTFINYERNMGMFTVVHYPLLSVKR